MLHSIEQHRILWITRGQGRITIDGRAGSYGPQSLIFIPAGITHSFELRPPVFGTALHIRALDYIGMPPDPMHVRLRDVAEQAEFNTLIENVQREINQPTRARIRACLLSFGVDWACGWNAQRIATQSSARRMRLPIWSNGLWR